MSDELPLKKEHKWLKRIVWSFVIILILLIVLVVIFFWETLFNKPKSQGVIIENPIKSIVFNNMNRATGEIDQEKVVEQAVKEFNAEYINYLLAAMGVGNLYSSPVYGNPKIEFLINDEIWNSEIRNKGLITQQGAIEGEDLKILISKQEVVNALLSQDISSFMKQSVINGNTQIEMVAKKLELGSKGYLGMYNVKPK